MSTQKSLTSLTRLATVVLVLVLAACKAGGPEFDGDKMVAFTGTVNTDGPSTHNFALTHEGTVQVEFTSIVETDGETGDPVDSPNLAARFGTPSGDDCVLSVTLILRQDQATSVFLGLGPTCVQVVLAGNPTVDTSADYVLELSGAFN